MLKENAAGGTAAHNEDVKVNGSEVKNLHINGNAYTSPNFTIVDDILEEVSEATTDGNTAPKPQSLFAIKSANSWIDEAKLRPMPRQLFKELWFEGEVCIMFADSNVGKSILAVQIGRDLAEREPVIYFDFELSDKQFELRYSRDFTDHYVFPNTFMRAEINPDSDFEGFDSFEDFLIYSLENVVIETGIKILIIDNITYLKNETDKAKNALPLMKQLKALKKKYELSILVLAHTPKRDLTKPLTQNDLGGSKLIMNFCDSAFAIGASHTDHNIRYIKQIKERNTPKIYGAENVLVYQIEKPENFLFMAFEAFGSEREHLKVRNEKEWDQLKETVKELHGKGNSIRQIQDKLKEHNINISVSTIHKYINS